MVLAGMPAAGRMVRRAASSLGVLLVASAVGLAVVGVAVVGVAVPARATPASTASADEVRRFIDSRTTALRLPSLAVVVIRDGETLVEHFVGEVDARTPFYLGSTSKQFTGLAVHALIADGRLSLDDRVGDVLPEFATATALTRGITVRQLLAHMSGWSTSTGLRQWGWFAGAPESIRGEAHVLAETELDHAPGTAFAYSNANYDLLGAVIEEVTGTSYAEALHDLVVEPLGLTRTTASPSEAEQWGVAPGHYTWFGVATVRTPAPRAPGAAPSAYVVSSADDLARVVRAHLGTISTDLPEGVLEAARQPLARVREDVGYASGWFVRRLWEATPPGGDRRDPSLPQCLEHNGNTDRSMTTMFVCPDAGLGVIALSNVGAGPDDAVLRRFRADLTRLVLGTPAVDRPGDFLVDNSSALMVGAPAIQGMLVGSSVASWRRNRRGRLPKVLTLVTLAYSAGVLWLALVHVPARAGSNTPLRSLWSAVPDIAVVTGIAILLALGALWLAVRQVVDVRAAARGSVDG